LKKFKKSPDALIGVVGRAEALIGLEATRKYGGFYGPTYVLIAAFVYDYLAREILCHCTTIICKIDNLLPINVINSRSESLSMLPINLSFIPSITFTNE